MKHTKISFKILLSTALFAGLFIASCKDDDNTTEQENITTIEVRLTGPSFDQTFAWKDLDGPGGNAPVIDSILLPQNLAGTANALSCQLHISDESQNPAKDLTTEIEAENTAHLFVYKLTGTALAQIAYDDADDNNENFGLKTRWVVNTGTGTVNILLYHEPTNKFDLNNPGGETDLDVTFPVKIQ